MANSMPAGSLEDRRVSFWSPFESELTFCIFTHFINLQQYYGGLLTRVSSLFTNGFFLEPESLRKREYSCSASSSLMWPTTHGALGFRPSSDGFDCMSAWREVSMLGVFVIEDVQSVCCRFLQAWNDRAEPCEQTVQRA